jgi:glucosyl-3-phosphoglycerate phosphatase
MTRLILWRHGQTEWNATGRVQGQTDVDLDETGIAQASEAGPRIADLRPDLVVSSDLRRATRTASVVAGLTDLPVSTDRRLRERSFGPWEGLTRPEIQAGYPDDFARWGGLEPIQNPQIETIEAVAERMAIALREVADQVGDGTAVVVTHGAAARAGLARVLGWPHQVWASVSVLGNCRYAQVTVTSERGWQLRAYNLS